MIAAVPSLALVWSSTWFPTKAIMPMENSPGILNPPQKTTANSGDATKNYTMPLQILSIKKTEMYQAYENAASCPPVQSFTKNPSLSMAQPPIVQKPAGSEQHIATDGCRMPCLPPRTVISFL